MMSDNDIIEFTAHTDCAICQSQYQEHDKVTMIGFCQHYYHKDCLTEWFRQKYTCPLCNYSILTTEVKRKIYTLCVLNRICKRFDESHFDSAVEHIKSCIKNFKLKNIKIEITNNEMATRAHLVYIIYQNANDIKRIFQIQNTDDILTHPIISQFYQEILQYTDINNVISKYSGTNIYIADDTPDKRRREAEAAAQNIIEQPTANNGIIDTVYKYISSYFNEPTK